MRKVYILYQTDTHKSRVSRVCFGVYSSETKALKVAKKEKLQDSNSDILIIEAELDKFEEL